MRLVLGFKPGTFESSTFYNSTCDVSNCFQNSECSRIIFLLELLSQCVYHAISTIVRLGTVVEYVVTAHGPTHQDKHKKKNKSMIDRQLLRVNSRSQQLFSFLMEIYYLPFTMSQHAQNSKWFIRIKYPDESSLFVTYDPRKICTAICRSVDY